jgi:hypothetical protein
VGHDPLGAADLGAEQVMIRARRLVQMRGRRYHNDRADML